MLHRVVVTLFHPHWRNNFRPKILHPIAYAYWIVLCFVVAGVVTFAGRFNDQVGGVLGFASSITPTQVLEQTNAQRTSRGLSGLSMNDALTRAAQDKASHMFANQYWAHNAPDGTQPWTFIKKQGYSYKVAGENLARDFGDTSGMVSAWMASPTHRDNILGNSYNEIGIAVVDGVLLGHETTLVVQMFGSPAGGTTPKTTANAVKTTAPKPVVEQQVVPVSPSPVAIAQAPTNILQADDVLVEQNTQLVAAPDVEVPTVLASMFVPLGKIDRPPLFSPLHVLKAFFVALTLLISSVLLYDLVISNNQGTVRIVGKNTAHILVLLAVLFLVLFFQGGVIG